MFQPQKPAFAQASPYGFNANATTSAASPFGGSAFGKPVGSTSTFGANTSFGATGAGANTNTGLFGAGTTGGLFGTNTATNAATSGFGGFGQAAAPAGNTGMFSTPQQPSTGGLFGQPAQQTQPFGANNSGFGFGQAATAPSSGLFGATAQNTSLFGQTGTPAAAGGLFGNTSTGFGGQQQQSGTVVKYNPVPGTDVMVKAGQSSNINIKHHCITCMKEYENKSLEELRLEDYTAGRRGPQAGSVGGMFGAPQATGGFGAPANTATPFGQANKPAGSLFGQNTGFGQPATTTSGGLFGNTSGFGAQQNSFGFGQTTQANTSGTLFGSPKPFGTPAAGTGTNLFGATTTQAPGAFGAIGTTNNSFGGFGTTPTQSQGLFGKAPGSTGFGLPQTSTSTAGFGFGQAGNTAAGGMFGNKLTTTAAPAFGTQAPAFGTGAGAFGASTSTAGGLFGGTSAFSAKPATAGTSFGYGPQQAGSGTGLTLGNPAGGGLFGGNKAPAAGGLQGFGGGSLFGGQQQANTNPLGFGTGNTSFGGLGQRIGPCFGGGTTLGQSGLGSGLGTSLGGGLGMNATPNTGFGGATSGASGGPNIHEQILTLVARPFGDSPLYKDLVPDSGREDASRATDPAAQRAIMEGAAYKLSPNNNSTRLRVRPLRTNTHQHSHDKQASLFDALEESDASLECKLTLRPNAKRLVLRPKQSPRINGDSGLADVNNAQQQMKRSLTEETAFEAVPKTNLSPEPLSPDNFARRTSQHSGKPRGRSDLEQDSDRRASWLTTKQLPKAAAPPSHLDSSNILEQTVAELHSAKPSSAPPPHTPGGLYPSLSAFSSSGLVNREDKENMDTPEQFLRSRFPENTFRSPQKSAPIAKKVNPIGCNILKPRCKLKVVPLKNDQFSQDIAGLESDFDKDMRFLEDLVEEEPREERIPRVGNTKSKTMLARMTDKLNDDRGAENLVRVEEIVANSIEDVSQGNEENEKDIEKLPSNLNLTCVELKRIGNSDVVNLTAHIVDYLKEPTEKMTYACGKNEATYVLNALVEGEDFLIKSVHEISLAGPNCAEDTAARGQSEPHPTGIKLTKPCYYTIPSLDDLISYLSEDGSCVVPCFTVGRHGYGNIHYDCQMDVAGLDLDAIVHFRNKQVIVYPDDVDKPALGAGLNRQAQVTLDQVWPRDKTARLPITDVARLEKMDYEGKLRAVSDKHETKFIEYRPETGSWVFRVDHFSKYGLTDSDEEEEAQAAVSSSSAGTVPAKVTEKIQGQAANTARGTTLGLGLGGLSGSVGLGGALLSGNGLVDVHARDKPINGSAKGLAMDTSEENSVDSTSMYADEADAGYHHEKGLRSPTSELARLEQRSSHTVQVMKAFLYQDECHDMDDDMSQSTPDQLVPQPRTAGSTAASLVLTAGARDSPRGSSVLAPSIRRTLNVDRDTESRNREVTLRPLIVKPLTVVMKKYREIIPLAKTIAGRVGASQLSDMGVSHARHFRVGWGRDGQLMTLTTDARSNTLNAVSRLPSLGRYIAGRSDTDTSPRLLLRLAVAGGNATVDSHKFAESIEGHLRALLSHCQVVTSSTSSKCPRVVLRRGPDNALSLLLAHLEEAEKLAQAERDAQNEFGVSAEYCYQTWALCKALWGADLENIGVPPTDDLSLLNRHRELSDWLRASVADEVERDLAKAPQPDPNDSSDSHSSAILTLVSGGRQLDACRLARQSGDYNMALLLAQFGGDACFRSLVGAQLRSWRECGALERLSAARVATLLLAAGRLSVARQDDTVHAAAGLSWRRAFALHYWYICGQVSTVGEALSAYEGSFRAGSGRHCGRESETGEGEEYDISLVTQEDMETEQEERGPVAFPHPRYMNNTCVKARKVGEDASLRKRILDLHYTLMKSRAGSHRPVIEPASHTPDPLDYRLSFLVHVWLSSVGVCGDVDAGTSAGLAAQLEAAGMWQWAIATLMHTQHDVARGQLVRGVLWRHVPASADSVEDKERINFLQDTLLLPRAWIRLAQAHRAKYENRPELEATHLAAAEQWNSAHKVLLEQLLPDAVLSERLDSLEPLLDQMMRASLRHKVSGWDSGGKALYEYMYVCKEMRSIVEDATCSMGREGGRGACREGVLGRLEALRPRVGAACLALEQAPPPSRPRDTRRALARCEMCSRLLHLSLAAATAAQPLLPAAAARQLARLVARLDLPPDYHHHMRAKLMGSITEDFSMEGRNWPPVSTNQSMDADLPRPLYCD